ncbi:MAG: dihydropteroate synthase [Balneolales bacterium]|nr:dihydropteroate synthase [Balneolales bacterium]
MVTLSFETPQVMGILNATPDSFSDGGKFNLISSALDRIHIMLEQGASIIDIGGESTRPGSDPVPEEEELNRVIPILKEAIKHFPNTLYSIDTTKYEVARQALDVGAKIVNDVSGLEKEVRFIELCKEYESGYVLMHSQGDPKTMQLKPAYEDVIDDLNSFFEDKIQVLKAGGVHNIFLDPGIGFGKKLEHNLKLISQLDTFQKFGFPLLVGASRKSMIGQLLDGRPTNERLTGTIAVHYHSLMKGATILRVHDVKEASDSIRIFNAIQSQS